MATKSEKLPKLYQYAVCPFCCKVKAILDYKKIPYEAIEVHPLNKKEIKFSKNYKKVPIWVDEDGLQVNDSTPIMKYLDEKFSHKPVFSQESPARQEEQQWLDWADKVLVRALPPVIYQNIPDALKAFDYITQEGKFNWLQQRTIKYSGALVMKMVAKKTAKSQGITDPASHLVQCLEKWEQALGNREFLGNTQPNGADLAVYGVLKSIENMPAFSFIQNNAKIYDWYQKVQSVCTAQAA